MELKLKNNSNLKLSPFAELEYIESTGTQYIDTNLSFSNGYLCECDIIPTSNSLSNAQIICGSQITVVTKMFFGLAAGKIKQWVNGSEGSDTNVVTVGNNYNIKVKSVNTDNYIKVNDVTKFTTNTIGTTDRDFYIFACNDNNTANYFAKLKLKTFKLYNHNNDLVLNLIPVKRKYDNVICMYDKVSETFFYNQGTGDFIAGPEVISDMHPALYKASTLYHENCPNINGWALLNSIYDWNINNQTEILDRIRVDIGNVEGSLSELLKFKDFRGLNDSYEPQEKPRLVGTWTINDWYTTEQLAEARATFDGITIVEDSNYLINWNDLAVQVLDDTQPNYNPAVAIILKEAELGHTLPAAPVSGQTGRWFLLKSEAQLITDISDIEEKTIVTDTNGIISSNITATYEFDTFNEFQYFTGIIYIYGRHYRRTCFYNCTKLKSIIFPSSITAIYSADPSFDYSGCFANCTSLEHVEVSENLTTIGNGSFYNCIKLNVLHLTHYCNISTQSGETIKSNTKVYVGNGISESDDNTLLNEFLNNSTWLQYFSSNLDTWYNYLHPTT